MTDHDGKLRVALAIVDGVNTQILYRETEEQPFRPVLTTNFKETVNFATFTPDNKMVYALTNIGRRQNRPCPDGSCHLRRKGSALHQ